MSARGSFANMTDAGGRVSAPEAVSGVESAAKQAFHAANEER